MCWNLDEENMSRAAAFITDSSRDTRCDETPASVEYKRRLVMGGHISRMSRSACLPSCASELWNFRSHVGLFSLCSESTIGGTFAPGSKSYMELSLPGTFALYQYEKRITVAPSTKECSSLPTNVALQSVLASRHVSLTYDVVSAKITKSQQNV